MIIQAFNKDSSLIGEPMNNLTEDQVNQAIDQFMLDGADNVEVLTDGGTLLATIHLNEEAA